MFLHLYMKVDALMSGLPECDAVFLIDRLACGGTPGYVMAILPELLRRGLNVRLLCLMDDGGLSGPLKEQGIEVDVLGLHKVFSCASIKTVLRLKREFGGKPLFVCHMFSSMIFGALCRLLGACSGCVLSWRDTGYWLGPARFYVLRWACRMSCGMLVNSQAVAEAASYVAGGVKVPVRLVYNGVKIPDITEKKDSGSLPVLGTLARFSQVKGQDLMLRALALLKKKNISFRARFGGDGATLDSCKALCRELELDDYVAFCGEISDPDSFYKDIDILVAPSRSEGFSNTIIEAMAREIPVVAFAAGGNAEAVEDGVDGFLAEEENIDALADRLVQLLGDAALRRNMGRAAREKILNRFSLAAMADNTAAAITEFSAIARGES